MGGFTLKTHQMFSVLTTREGFKNATISGYYAQTWKSYDYHNVIAFKKLLSKNVFVHTKPAFSDSSGLTSVFEKLRFRDGLVWTVGLTVEKKLCFQTTPV